MEEGKGFCKHCGAKVSVNDAYCPECKAPLHPEAQRSADMSFLFQQVMKLTLILLGVYSVISILEGVYCAASPDACTTMIKAVYGDTQWASNLASLGLTEAGYSNMLRLEGIVSIIDGVAVAIAFVLCYMRRCWLLAFSLCIYASLFIFAPAVFLNIASLRSEMIMMLAQAIVGLFVARSVYVVRAMFRS